MAQQTHLGRVATTVTKKNGLLVVAYHSTNVVEAGPAKICLDTGGWKTHTTKTRMNQAAAQFGLPYHVRQSKGVWRVRYTGKDGHERDELFAGNVFSFEYKPD